MTSPNTTSITSAAVIGMGSVGAGWAAILLAKGVKVYAYDSGHNAKQVASELIEGSWPSLMQMGLTEFPKPPLFEITYCDSVAEASERAQVIFENVPEAIALKKNIITQVESSACSDALILSSAGGIPASILQEDAQNPERVMVMHPFNPSHLIPLVEVVPGKLTLAVHVDRAKQFVEFLGKRAITVSKEKTGHMVNRLQFALVREAVACMIDGTATAQDIDKAVRYGLAPRWLLMGGLQTFGMAGGPSGMAGIIEKAGEAIQQWWIPSPEPTITDEVRNQLIKVANEMDGGASFEDWVSWRDSQLVSVLELQKVADAMRPQSE